MDKQKAIENIIENFDFDKVHKVMTFLNWGWATVEEGGIPSIGKLIIHSQKYLSDVFDMCTRTKKDYYTGTGGFFVEAQYNNEENCCDYLKLRFELDSWDSYDE